MAAGHESHDSRDYQGPGRGPVGPEVPGGDDPLMAALLGEPLPASAREDAALTAAHRAALADLALLREHLGIIGHALADAGQGEGAGAGISRRGVGGAGGAVVRPLVPGRPRRPRWRAAALGGLVAACVAAVLSGAAWLFTQAGGPGGHGASDSAAAGKEAVGSGSGFGSPRYLACARLVVEGTVTGTEPVRGTGERRITLDVTRAYRPDGERRRTEPVVFLAPDGVEVRLGEYALVGLPRRGDHPDALVTGAARVAAERERLLRALPDAQGFTCPRT